MSKNEFLERLRKNLASLSIEERENAVRYYEEFFDECENDEVAAQQLGSPEEIAQQILKENGIENPVPPMSEPVKEKSKVNIGLVIAIIILTFPLWIGIVAVAFCLLVAVIAIVFALVVSAVAIAGACLSAGTVLLFTGTSIGLILIGIGLVAVSLFMLIITPFAKSMFGTIKKFINWVKNSVRKIFNKGVN